MKAIVYHKPKDMRYEDVSEPRIEHAQDVILRVTSTTICGSDLHIYNGYFPQARPMVLGHEFMGIVEEVGPRVTKLKKGDRVVVPFPIACGQCFFCARGLAVHCEKSNAKNYGPDGGVLTEKGGGLFGYTDVYGSYSGGQAELVRVPWADFGPRKVPEGMPDEKALFLSDIIPTGWTAAKWCGIKTGDVVAVLGCGPVGLMALKSAKLQGAAKVIGVDRVPERLKLARTACEAEAIDAEAGDPVEAIREMTEGRGADAVIDAVGMEAEHGWRESLSNVLHLQVGVIHALKTALRAVRRGGTVSVVGVYGTSVSAFPLGQFFDKGLTMRGGQAPVHAVIDELIPLVAAGKLTAEDIVTHSLRLSDGPKAYEAFNDKRDGFVKAILRP